MQRAAAKFVPSELIENDGPGGGQEDKDLHVDADAADPAVDQLGPICPHPESAAQEVGDDVGRYDGQRIQQDQKGPALSS